MAEEKWFVALDGAQIEGEHDAEMIRQLMARNPGKPLVVWNEKMADWADPATLPAFRAAAAPRESKVDEANRQLAQARAQISSMMRTSQSTGRCGPWSSSVAMGTTTTRSSRATSRISGHVISR